MTPFLNTVHRKLLEQKYSLLKTLASSHTELQVALSTPLGADINDAASIDLDRELINLIDEENKKALKKIDNALARIANGNYGLCLNCSKTIDKGRLEAMPEAILCLQCQTQAEKFNGR